MSSSSRARKRDTVWDIFRKAKGSSVSQQSTSQTTISGISEPTTSLTISAEQRFWEKALVDLTPKEQATIREHLAPNTEDIRVVASQAYDAALTKQSVCESKKWHWKFRGKDLVLRDEAEKVLLLLDRVKSVGDVVANVDPIHIGLPWAGIRMVLQMTLAENYQMATLLTGMSLSLDMIHRLDAYFAYFKRLPATPTTMNFEEVLIKAYTHVLRFIATALQTYQKAFANRTLCALWDTTNLEGFGTVCERLATQADVAANMCERELNNQDRLTALRWKAHLNQTLEKLDGIKDIATSLDNLHIKVDLTKLMIVEGATFDSYAEGNTARCLEGTRTGLLQRITDWTDDPDSKCIFWLCGMAGTGKSTISRTVGELLDKRHRLGASFFFKRGEGDRGKATRFFPTIARQMADAIPGLDRSIAKSLDADSLLSQRRLQEQFEQLLMQPLLEVPKQAHPSRNVILIDALDECEDQNDTRTILKLLAQLESLRSFRVRILVTSRPELPIQIGFKKIDGALHQDLILEEVQATTIERDIRLYLRHRFKEIQIEDAMSCSYDPLPSGWPGDDRIEALVELAVPLFVFAFTVCRYISERDPRNRLDTILQQQDSLSLTSLGKTYVPILSQAVFYQDEHDRQHAIAAFQNVVGPIVLLANPLSAMSLSNLIDIPLRDINDTLKPLHSVLNIPDSPKSPIRLLHLSFRDFLVNPRGSNETTGFHIDKTRTHSMLAEHCLRLLNQPQILRKDICNVGKPGTRRVDISSEHVTDCITADVAYACSYWTEHIVKSGEQLNDDGPVHSFLTNHLLHWLEVLSWLGRLSSAVHHVTELRSLCHVEDGSRLLEFLDDAGRFFPRSRSIIDAAPLQLYYSALAFLPSESVMRRTFQHDCAEYFDILPNVPSNWSSEILRLDGSDPGLIEVGFSPDGSKVISASMGRTVRLWSFWTGEQLRMLEQPYYLVTWSPDCKIVAFAEESVRLWDIHTGEELQELKEYNGSITALAFSPDGSEIALATDDCTVRLLNVATGKEIRKLRGNEQIVSSVSYSPDGSMLATATGDHTVQLWKAVNGDRTQTLEGIDSFMGFEGIRNKIVFSPDGEIVALVEGNLWLWNVRTGRRMKNLEKFVVSAMAFSSDGKTVATAEPETLHIWILLTGEEIQILEGHTSLVNAIAFSPDGKSLASASDDKTVRLWNAFTNEEAQKLEGHDCTLRKIAISENGQVVATASADCVMLWNTVTWEKPLRPKISWKGDDDPSFPWEDISLSPDGEMLAIAQLVSDPRHLTWAIRLLDTKSGEEIREFRCCSEYDVNEILQFPPSFALLHGNVRLYDVRTGEKASTLNINHIGHAQGSSKDDVPSANDSNQPWQVLDWFAQQGGSAHGALLEIDGQWIQHRGEDVLWLPYEYLSNCWAARGNILAVGQESGAVSFFRCI